MEMKEGDFRDCNNWRGVTLLPIISKIFQRILIGRIKRGVDKTLQKEQAGFRPNDSATEQILMIKKITSQSR